MAELLLVNPRRRKRRSGGRRRRRAMTAKQLQYFGPRRKRRSSRRRSRRRAAALAGPMPARRTRRIGRRHRRRSMRHRARGFRRRAAMSVRGFNLSSFLNQTLVPSAVGAGGAIAVDVLLGYLSPNLPAALQTGIAVPLVRIASAVGLGMAASTLTKDRRMGEQVMAGAITVVLYGYAKNMLKQQFPSVPGLSGYVSGFGYAGPALAYPDMSGGMAAYVGASPRWDPSVAARLGRGVTRTVVPRHGMSGVTNDEYIEGGYSYA